MASRLLTGVRLRPYTNTQIGALGGLLDSVGRPLETHELLGKTGAAFQMTIDLVFSPSAPYEANLFDLIPLWENLGAWFRHRRTRRDSPDWAEARQEGLERIRDAIDRGRPAIVYDLGGLLEYGLVVGYDEERLACLTLASPEEPVWMPLTDWPSPQPTSRVEVITLLDIAPGFDERKADRQALRAAVESFWQPPSADMWLQHGVKAWDFWVMTLASSLPLHGSPGLGHSFHLKFLHAARTEAAAYLRACAARYPEAEPLAAAAEACNRLVAHLFAATEILPFPGQVEMTRELRDRLAAVLRDANDAEREMIDQIERALRYLR
jgi:hypothetical protein